jgi:hypothetical protein
MKERGALAVGLVCLWHIAAVIVACPRCHVESDVRCVAVFLDLKTLPHTELHGNVAVFLSLKTLPHSALSTDQPLLIIPALAARWRCIPPLSLSLGPYF